MAIVKQYTRRLDDAGRIDPIQTLTNASTATRVKNFGVTLLTNSTANNTFIMDAPRPGLRKTLIADPNSTGDIVLAQASTAITFYGSTTNLITFSTGVGVKVADLIGVSTSQWAIVSRTTGLTLTGSTISG